MTANPRVLWVGHFPPYPPKGGAMQRSFNMLKEMSRFSSIDLLSLAPSSKVCAFYADYNDGMRDINENLEPYCNSISLVKHGMQRRNFNKWIQGLKSLVSTQPYDVISLYSTAMASKVEGALKTVGYDVVYVDTIGLVPYVLGRHGNIVLNHHNIESAMLDRRASLSEQRLMSFYLRWQAKRTASLERRAVRSVATNFVCSALDKERLEYDCEGNVNIVPNGVDISYFYRDREYCPSGVRGCIFAGGLDWYPNAKAVDFIVNEIVPLLPADSEAYPITICGKGANKALDRVSRTNPNVVSAGFVRDIRTYLESAALYLCPIVDGGGTKLKVLDALAMGVPIIASAAACEGIDVVDGKHVVFAESAEDFKVSIDELMRSPETRSQLSKNGRLLIEEKYSYHLIGRNLERIFEDLANNRRAGGRP